MAAICLGLNMLKCCFIIVKKGHVLHVIFNILLSIFLIKLTSVTHFKSIFTVVAVAPYHINIMGHLPGQNI